MLANRLRKNQRLLRKWARKNAITCYRLYEKDIPDQPVIVDWYDGRAVIYVTRRKKDETEAAHLAWMEEVKQAVMEGLDLPGEQLYFKGRGRRKAGAQYEKLADRHEEFVVTEFGHRFIVNLSDYLDTGLFLDHRNTRRIVGEEAAGKDFLNLFAYTGTFTVYAAKGGARSTTTVDLSATYLDWAERNFELNGLEPQTNGTERADVLRWLPHAQRKGWKYDLIVCDPPTFSASKRMQDTFDVQRQHPEIINGCLRLLRSGGTLYFSTNYRGFDLEEAALLPSSREEITPDTIPPDFRNKRIHRCWRIQSK
ncbi:MAG: class I SAM-dependent methyltransferase [Armatimonadetes bacterium]|nr:class I SAM-dependent methyltransferase [Armatimonadota bacterium]